MSHDKQALLADLERLLGHWEAEVPRCEGDEQERLQSCIAGLRHIVVAHNRTPEQVREIIAEIDRELCGD